MSAVTGTLLLVSDIHAHYHVVNAQVEHAESKGGSIDRVLVLGDFGLFAPNLHRHFRRDGHRFARPVAFIEGNHEDFVAFDRLVSSYQDVVTHLPRGSVQRFGRWRCLCIGGARYMDAWSTPQGSEIRETDIAECLSHEPGSIDIIISHDCPAGINVASNPEMAHLGAPGDPGLDRVARHLRPTWWFFGHHHRWHQCEREGTRFIGLPESWQGYALLNEAGELQQVEHAVELPPRPSWWRWIGLK